jgi:hypothetical protein
MLRLGVLLMLSLLTSAASAQWEQQDHSSEIYALASASDTSPGSATAAGFCFGGAWKPSPRVGLVANFGRHFVSGAHLSFNTFMVGPRFYSEEQYRLSGFFQVLAGAEHTTTAGQPTNWNVVLAPGVGADIRLTDRLVWRAVAVDLTLTRGPGLLRVSSGFAFRLGH